MATKECKNNKTVNICKNCGKEFLTYSNAAKTNQYCCRKCYEDFRSKHLNKICPICNNEYKATYRNQTFCSVECRVKSTEKQIQTVCDGCGIEFSIPYNQYSRSNKHYCSFECRKRNAFWSEKDIEILKHIYEEKGRVKYDDVAGLIDPKWDKDAVKRKCKAEGFTTNREWTEDETNLLIENYHQKTFEELTELIPRKTEAAIKSKARQLNLYSKYYVESVFTKEDEQTLIENYKTMTNEEMGVMLNRSTSSITNKLFSMGLRRKNEIINVDVPLSKFLRGKIEQICTEYKRQHNEVCEITHKKCDVTMHHIKSFSILILETLDILGLPYTIKKEDLSESELQKLAKVFIENHERQKKYVVIDKNIHSRFHKIYGNGYNTEEEWNEFLKSIK